jgi:hypothetical protein
MQHWPREFACPPFAGRANATKRRGSRRAPKKCRAPLTGRRAYEAVSARAATIALTNGFM